MELESEKFIRFVKSAWIKYEYKIILAIGFLLVAGLSFEFGYMQGQKGQTNPIVIEKPTESPKIGLEEAFSGTMGSNSTLVQKAPAQGISPLPKDCAFVGSKNSTKYHTSTCSWAKRILPKNLVCFKSAEDAIAQGRVGDKGCIK